LANFDAEKYTRDSILEQLSLIELHARDGSAVEAGCGCIEEKHLIILSGLCNEAMTLMSNKNEAEYYANLGKLARLKRQEILNGDFDTKTVSCEAKVARCVADGKTEGECRSVHNCES